MCPSGLVPTTPAEAADTIVPMELQTLGHWGMPNAAHLSRTFRAAYGAPPAEFRARSAKPAPDES